MPFFAYLIPFSLIIGLIFVLGTIFHSDKTISRRKVMKDGFITLVTFLSLAATVSSLIALGHWSLSNWVFPDVNNYYNFPYPLSFPPSSTMVQVNDDQKCTSETKECPFNQDRLNEIKQWTSDYKDWQANQEEESQANYQEVIDALSIIIISLPLFIFFFLIARRSDINSINKQIYNYCIIFVSLTVLAISLGLLINAGLKSWLIPESGQWSGWTPPVVYDNNETTNPELIRQKTISSCADACGLTAEQRDLINHWPQDFQASNNQTQKYNRYQETMATTIPIIIFTLPVFLYYFIIIKKENQDQNNCKQDI